MLLLIRFCLRFLIGLLLRLIVSGLGTRLIVRCETCDLLVFAKLTDVALHMTMVTYLVFMATVSRCVVP